MSRGLLMTPRWMRCGVVAAQAVFLLCANSSPGAESPHIESCEASPCARFTWTACTGACYQMEVAGSLTAAWTNLATPILATGCLAQCTVATPESSQAFFRLRNLDRYWERFPKPPGRAESAYCKWLGLDARTNLWIMTANGTYWWNSASNLWAPTGLQSGMYLAQLYGGHGQDLYATQSGTIANWGQLYRVEAGAATYVTNFYYDHAWDAPGVYVSRDGRMVNWGGNTLRVYAHGARLEAPVSLPQTGPLVFDQGEIVSVYCTGFVHAVSGMSTIETREVHAGVNRSAAYGALWGTDRAIVLGYNQAGVSAFTLPTGGAVNVDAINTALGGRNLYDLFRTPDGAVWILAYDSGLSSYVLFRVSTDGTTAMVADTAGIPWDNRQFSSSGSTCVSVDACGTIWFASSQVGVFRLDGGRITQFDHRLDGSPATCSSLLGRPDGVLFAATDIGVYACNLGASITGQERTEPIPVEQLGATNWTWSAGVSDWLRKFWDVDDAVYCTYYVRTNLTALDARTGQVRYELPLTALDADYTWVAPGSETGELAVCRYNQILRVQASTGAVRHNVSTTRDSRIAPVPASGTNYALIKTYRGTTLVRMDSAGSNVWSASLPGYVMSHPSLHGSVLLAQTRSGSYGGQTTLGINMGTGARLWTAVTDAYGGGTEFAADGSYCVETDEYMCPSYTEAWVISRDPVTGNTNWHFRCSGSLVEHRPIVDSASNRVYAAFSDGTVVCLDARDGTLVWQRVLPQPPLSAPEPYQPAMFLTDGALLITDRTQLTYFIDPVTGTVRHRFAATVDIFRHGKRAGSIPLIAAPRLVAGRFIVPTMEGISAFTME